MSIQYMDNFQFYGTSTANMLDGLPWSSIAGSLVSDPDGSSAGNVLRVVSTSSNSNTTDTRLSLPTVTNKIGIAQRYYMNSLPSSTGLRPSLVALRSISNSKMFDVVVEPNGSISLYSGSGLTLVATTTNPVMAPKSWFHYEHYFDLAAGTYELRIEGTTVLTASSLTLGSVYLIGFPARNDNNSNSNAQNYMKDLVFWDGSGSSNNSFLGPVAVYTLKVNGDVSSGWTTSTGTTQYTLLDETTPDDTDYISADTTLPAAAIFDMEDLGPDIVGVRGIQTMVRAKKSDGGDATLQVSLKSGASIDLGSTHNVTTSMKYWFDISEFDPATGSAWDPIAVNAAKLKVDRTV